MTSIKIPYKAIRNSIITLLQSNYVTVNLDLPDSQQFVNSDQVFGGHPEVKPVSANQYPVLMVQLNDNNEFFRSAGGDKDATVVYQVFCCVRVPGGEQDDEDAAMDLASNVEGLFRQNIEFNVDVIKSSPSGTNFMIMDPDKSTYVAVSAIDVECTVIVEV